EYFVVNTMNTIPLPLRLLVAVSLAVAGVAGDDEKTCPGAPTMTVESACRNVSGTQAMYDTCRDALAGVADPLSDHDVTVYALAAAHGAAASAEATMGAAIDEVRNNRSLPGDERDAYMECAVDYSTALHAMGSVVDKLDGCSFDGLAGDYLNGLIDVENCRDRVLKLPASPLYAMVLVDRNKAGMALFLGKLLGI
ncbi:Os08g0142500, partial [Oryza sativa Japonica Group]